MPSQGSRDSSAMRVEYRMQAGVRRDMTSLWFGSALLPEGWADRVRVSARDGRIEDISVGVDPVDSDERLDVGIPGMPNLHSHAFQRGIAGLTARRGPGGERFLTW